MRAGDAFISGMSGRAGGGSSRIDCLVLRADEAELFGVRLVIRMTVAAAGPYSSRRRKCKTKLVQSALSSTDVYGLRSLIGKCERKNHIVS
jgi:hypothetical protein